MDGIQLEFEPDALREIAKQAISRKSGARGLRAIIESVMLDTMFELPSRADVEKCVIDVDAVDGKSKPKLILTEKKRKTRRRTERDDSFVRGSFRGEHFSKEKRSPPGPPFEEKDGGRRWGRGRFSKRSASPPRPLSRRVAGNRLVRSCGLVRPCEYGCVSNRLGCGHGG